MKFEFTLVETLPKLAWCAVIRFGDPSVKVFHGPWVETRKECFFEGAWDGEFEKCEFTEATTFVGSGAAILSGKLVFSAPTDMYDSLSCLRSESNLFVSNSRVFAMVAAQDGPDISYPDYHFDLIHMRRWGLKKPIGRLCTRRGRSLFECKWENFQISPDGELSRVCRPKLPPPSNYHEYVDSLERTMAKLLKNASHSSRRITFQPLATVSSGYDCNALAALASRGGCDQAITFYGPISHYDYRDDDGSAIGASLELKVSRYDRLEYASRSGSVEAEFAAASCWPGGSPLVAVEKKLEGTLLITGRPGEDIWGLEQVYNLPDLMCPEARNSTGSSLNEFRLRVGFLHFQAAYIQARHRQQIQAISSSKEMQRYSLGGKYDRPIPRRILEDAGVPRECFGQKKVGGSHFTVLSEDSQESFETFYEKAALPQWFQKSPRFRVQDIPDALITALHWLAATRRFQPEHRPLYRFLLPLLLISNRRSRRFFSYGKKLHGYDWRYLYLFHWGFDMVKDRYRLDHHL